MNTCISSIDTGTIHTDPAGNANVPADHVSAPLSELSSGFLLGLKSIDFNSGSESALSCPVLDGLRNPPETARHFCIAQPVVDCKGLNRLNQLVPIAPYNVLLNSMHFSCVPSVNPLIGTDITINKSISVVSMLGLEDVVVNSGAAKKEGINSKLKIEQRIDYSLLQENNEVPKEIGARVLLPWRHSSITLGMFLPEVDENSHQPVDILSSHSDSDSDALTDFEFIDIEEGNPTGID